MKTWIKMILISLIVLFIFACEEKDEEIIYSTIIQIVNFSDFGATVWIYNLGYTPITVNVSANSTLDVVIEDGDGGLNVNGGRAIVEYAHQYLGYLVPDTYQTYVDLIPDITAQVQIDNTFGCLLVRNYSTNTQGEMWINIDYGASQVIAPWEDLVSFYDPWPYTQVTKSVQYNGYTIFSGEIDVNIQEDDLIILELHPDACGIWVENHSAYDDIDGVYISPSSEPTWGSNDLNGLIQPGEWVAWVCEANMSWDIKVTDQFYEYTFYDVYLVIDDIYTIIYDDSRLNLDPDSEKSKRENARNHEVTNTSPRCEMIALESMPIKK
ncbi:MAG: hypothetical protein K9N06_00430 [Candidatus Cloacimonetes bacterium]|nr:hypothetical protein [Candidatus Cloacimonadota bacterium]